MFFRKKENTLSPEEREELRQHYHGLISARIPRDAESMHLAKLPYPTDDLYSQHYVAELRRELIETATNLAIRHHSVLTQALNRAGNTKTFSEFETEVRQAFIFIIEKHHLPNSEAASKHLADQVRRAVRTGAYRRKPTPPPTVGERISGWATRMADKMEMLSVQYYDVQKIPPMAEIKEGYEAATANSKLFTAKDAMELLGLPYEKVPRLLLDEIMFNTFKHDLLAAASSEGPYTHAMIPEGCSIPRQRLRDELKRDYKKVFREIMNDYGFNDAPAESMAERLSIEMAYRMEPLLRARQQHSR